MKKMLLIFMLLCFGFVVYGEDLNQLVSADQAEQLLAGEPLSAMRTSNPSPSLMPNQAGVQELIQSVQQSLDPSIMVESLFLYKKPANANRGAWTEVERTAIYNQSLALSSLAGIEYYSTSRKKMRTFYETSAIIDNSESKSPQKDPSFSVPPKELQLIARQKDLTFGDNIYKYTYHAEDDYLVFIQENLTIINAGIIHVAGKNKLRSVVSIIDAGEYFLIYVVSMADAVLLPILNERVGNSFSTRAEAILSWFTSQAEKAFQHAEGN
jgi:hypothetical protein